MGYNKCYIGSTTEELSMRMARHRSNFKRFLRGDKESHIRSFDIFNEYGVENCKIELIQYYAIHYKSYKGKKGSISKILNVLINV